jgi:hypothetical protein
MDATGAAGSPGVLAGAIAESEAEIGGEEEGIMSFPLGNNLAHKPEISASR